MWFRVTASDRSKDECPAQAHRASLKMRKYLWSSVFSFFGGEKWVTLSKVIAWGSRVAERGRECGTATCVQFCPSLKHHQALGITGKRLSSERKMARAGGSNWLTTELHACPPYSKIQRIKHYGVMHACRKVTLWRKICTSLLTSRFCKIFIHTWRNWSLLGVSND